MVPSGEIEVSFFASGYCTAQAKVVNPRGTWGIRRFYAVWALIKHPDLGILLFDGGYTASFDKATKRWPDRLYRWITPVIVHSEDSAVAILKREGIQPSDVNYFIVSHFHADHICALKDFPQAKYICSHEAFRQINVLKGYAAIRTGLLKDLLPDDFGERTLFVENISRTVVDADSRLTFYLPFGQDKLQFVDLPGHARGMFGFYLKTRDSEILYATDAAWDKDAFINNTLPSLVVNLFFDSWKAYKDTYKKLFDFVKHNPKAELLFTHCPQTLKFVKNVFLR